MKLLRFLAVALAFIMLLSVVGCAPNDNTDGTNTDPESDPETNPGSPFGTTPEEPTEPMTDPETDPETVPGTDPETVPGTDPETDPETNPETNPETDPETQPETQPETEPDKEPEEEPVDLFKKYQSNIVYGTGNNKMISSENGSTEIATYRAVFEVQEYGEFEYSLFFSNNIDSSSGGFSTYRDMPTESYKILYAALRTTDNIKGLLNVSDPTELTFDGKKTKTVAPGETFWCDPVTFNVNRHDYLVFEWTVEYTKIPGTIIAQTYYAYKSDSYGDSLYLPMTTPTAGSAPMPDLIGCTRNNETRLTFIGDSITMGTGSGAYMNAFWVKQIADQLGDGYSVWNLGLDSARADDVIKGTSFKEKLKHTDILSICIGINDIAGGVYGKSDVGAKKIYESIAAIAQMAEDAGAKVIIFSVPPFNLTGIKKDKWDIVNLNLKMLAEEKGYDFFDFAAVLGHPDNPDRCQYGDHPNKIGCTAVAEAFMDSGILEPVFKD